MNNVIKKRITIVLGILFLIVAVLTIQVMSTSETSAPFSELTSINDAADIKLTVETPSFRKTEISINFQDNETLINLMNRVVEKDKSFNFKTTDSSFGPYLTEVNGYKANDSKKEFWKIVINSKDSQEGIGTYIVKKNDVIEFKIDTF
jgi:hypothetical protein